MSDTKETIESVAPERIKQAMAKAPGSFITDRGLEVKHANGSVELLISHRGLKSGLDATLAPKAATTQKVAPAVAATKTPAATKAAPAAAKAPANKPGPKPAAKVETEKKVD